MEDPSPATEDSPHIADSDLHTDSSSEAGSNGRLGGLEVQEKHKEILKEMLSFETYEGPTFDDFKNRYEEYFDAHDGWQRTLLHNMILEPRWEEDFEDRARFAEWLQGTYPDLILKTDDRGETALFNAIVFARAKYAGCFIKFDKARDALAILASRGRNCLHIAFAKYKGSCKTIFLDWKEIWRDPIWTAGDSEGNTPLHIAVATSKIEPKTIERLIQVCPEAVAILNLQGESPYLYLHRLQHARPKIRRLKPVKLAEVADLLMLAWRQIKLDLRGETKVRISKQYLRGLQKAMIFEPILQYVSLPKLTIDDIETSFASVSKGRSRGRQYESTRPDGKRHIERIFFWLKHELGVQRILRVTVDDDDEFPHSDHVIGRALEGLRVEIWDWKKFDICTDTIRRAAPEVTDVYLYSTGNLAVLKSWGSEDGLITLRHLQTVYLTVNSPIEPEDIIENYVRIIDIRLHELPGAKLVYVKDRKDVGDTALLPNRLPEWLNTIDTFAQFLRHLRDFRRADSEPDTRVAIIDDGVDIENEGLRVTSGRTFSESEGDDREFFVGCGGHGNKVATVINRLLPFASLYIARLDQSPDLDGHMKFSLSSIIAAIKWATRVQADIICIAWDFDQRLQSMTELRDTLVEARENGVVVICAAPDYEDFDLLSAAIVIGASEIPRRRGLTTQDTAEFYFPAEEGIIQAATSTPFETSQLKSPNTLATAVASGVATLFLYCMKLTDLEPHHRNIASTEMRNMFRNTCAIGSHNSEFWTFFRRFERHYIEDEKCLLEKLKQVVEGLRRESKV